MLCAGLAAPAAAQAAFPGTPGQLIYTCAGSSSDETSHICVINPDGSGNRRIVTDAGSPAWSPDGIHYAYIKSAPSELQGANPEERIHISNINGDSAIRRLENESRAFSPAFAPDGIRLAFVDEGKLGGDQSDIWVTDLSNRRRNLTGNAVGNDGVPEWSPDGRRIAFSSNREDGKDEIYTVDVATGAVARVTRSPSGASSGAPSWSPDGTKIAFVRDQSGEEGRAADVWVVNADGTGERPVTDYFGSGRFNVVAGLPAWSPDGARIAFSVSVDEGNDELRVIGADGSGETPLGVTGYAPDWGVVAGTGPAQPLAVPQLSRLKLGRRAIWAAMPNLVRVTSRDGMPLSFRMSSAAAVRIGVQRVSRGRPRGRPVITASGLLVRQGTNRLRWLGVYANGIEVPRGTYRLVLIPFNLLGDLGPTVNSRSFRVQGSCLERRSRPCQPR